MKNMRKTMALSAVAVGALFAGNAMAADVAAC